MFCVDRCFISSFLLVISEEFNDSLHVFHHYALSFSSVIHVNKKNYKLIRCFSLGSNIMILLSSQTFRYLPVPNLLKCELLSQSEIASVRAFYCSFNFNLHSTRTFNLHFPRKRTINCCVVFFSVYASRTIKIHYYIAR